MGRVGLEPGVPETGKRNRATLKNYPDWEEWEEYGFSHLNAMDKYNMFGPPYRIPHVSIVIRQVWAYVIKNSVKMKSINCCDGYPLIVKCIQYAKNYGPYASQHGLVIFISLSTSLGYIIISDDDINAYNQAPPPEEPFCVHVDYQYRYWYPAKNGT